MKMTGSYPVLLVETVQPIADFYERHFLYTREFDTDWYVHMRSSSLASAELAIMRYDHATIPVPGRRPTVGLILNIEVEDAAEASPGLRPPVSPSISPCATSPSASAISSPPIPMGS